MFPLTVKYDSPILEKATARLKILQRPGKLSEMFEKNFNDSISRIPENQTLKAAYSDASNEEHIDHLCLESEIERFRVVLKPSIQMIAKEQHLCLKDTSDPDSPDIYLEKGMDFIKALNTVKPLTAFPIEVPMIDGKLIDIQFTRTEYEQPEICPTAIFTIGDKSLEEFWGDDWNDREDSDPVYEQYVKENLLMPIPLFTEIIDLVDKYESHLSRQDCIEQESALINIYQDEENYFIPMCLDADNLLEILYLCHFFDPERYFWMD